MQKYTRILAVLLILTILLTNFTACVNKQGYSTPQPDVLTQKVIEKDKIPVTVLVKYAFSINAFEVAVENKFPNLDLVQVGNFTSDMGLDEYEARMKNDDLTDIVMTWPLDCGSQYLEERLLDLSAMPFTSNYNISKLNEISRDGKLYYLPGPSQIRGIVYNKTLFAEKGWEVPTDFDGFISLCKQIEATGIRSLQLGLDDPEVLDTAFIGYSFANCYATPKDTQWIMDYNNGVGSLGDHFAPAFEVFQTLIDNGILKPEDLNINYAQRERMLFDRKCAMIEDSVLLARMGNEIAGNDDEFALMPFFSPVSDGDWARLYPVCYIGLNQHLSEPQNKAKYDLVMQIMEYISTPEGQRALASDTGAMYSSLNGMPPPNDVPEIKALLPALEHGRCAIFPTFKNAQGALREGLAGILTGKLTAENVIQMVDAVNLDPPAAPPPTVIGNASDNFTIMDMGNFLTDAMR
ncbi:MAG: ABC transporter substrate-binding protein, partial [Oscillospiraceae bacterium]